MTLVGKLYGRTDATGAWGDLEAGAKVGFFRLIVGGGVYGILSGARDASVLMLFLKLVWLRRHDMGG